MSDPMFSGGEILSGGLSGQRRARALLYLILEEASRGAAHRTGYVSAVADDGLGLAWTHDDDMLRDPLPGESDESYIALFRGALRSGPPATIPQLETSTQWWRPLIPSDLSLRVRVFALLADRFPLERGRTRKIGAVFGVDTPEFAQAFHATTGSPIDDAFVADTRYGARVRSMFGRRRIARPVPIDSSR